MPGTTMGSKPTARAVATTYMAAWPRRSTLRNISMPMVPTMAKTTRPVAPMTEAGMTLIRADRGENTPNRIRNSPPTAVT